MSQPLVIIGNGMAAARLVQELAKRSLGRYAIAVTRDDGLVGVGLRQLHPGDEDVPRDLRESRRDLRARQPAALGEMRNHLRAEPGPSALAAHRFIVSHQPGSAGWAVSNVRRWRTGGAPCASMASCSCRSRQPGWVRRRSFARSPTSVKPT